jgi:uncharacterized oligopeptide transporter (OPT) family protein
LMSFGVIGPWLYTKGVVHSVSFGYLVHATLWPGAALLVSSGIVALVFQMRGMGHWLWSTLRRLQARSSDNADPLDPIECPAWWFYGGFLILSPIAILLMNQLFAIPLWAGFIAIPLALLMGVVAARVTGETDITPTKALGPATQLIYGALLLGQITANIMSSNVTGGVGLHAADLLSDLKTGWLLGANPRKQFIAQLFGVVGGAVAVVPAFRLLIPNANALGTDAFPAPAVLVWAAVSRAMTRGVSALSPLILSLVVVAFALGIFLSLTDRLAPQQLSKFVPSASGLGIAMVLPASMSATMCLGALIAYVLRRRYHNADARIIPAASGAIAGESLMGVLLAILTAVGVWGR